MRFLIDECLHESLVFRKQIDKGEVGPAQV
jgi:hypothetical protein